MEYVSKGFRFDTEVMAWLDKLKAMHGSYNKGLRLIAFSEESRGKPPIDVEAYSVAASRVCGQPTVGEAQMSRPAAEVLDKARARIRPRKQTKAAIAIQARASSDIVARAAERDDIDYSDVDSAPTVNVANLRGTTGAMAAGTQSAMEKWRASRQPLGKPKDQK